MKIPVDAHFLKCDYCGAISTEPEYSGLSVEGDKDSIERCRFTLENQMKTMRWDRGDDPLYQHVWKELMGLKTDNAECKHICPECACKIKKYIRKEAKRLKRAKRLYLGAY